MNINKFVYHDFFESNKTEIEILKEIPLANIPQEAVIEPVIIEPSFTTQDIEKAKKDGFKEGYLKAKTEIDSQKESSDKNIEEILDKINFQIAAVITDQNNCLLEIKGDILAISIKLMEKLYGELSDSSHDKIIAMVEKYLDVIAGELPINITLNPVTNSSISAQLSKIIEKSASSSKVFIKESDNIAIGDAMIECGKTTIEFSLKKLWEKIANII